MALPDQNTITW